MEAAACDEHITTSGHARAQAGALYDVAEIDREVVAAEISRVHFRNLAFDVFSCLPGCTGLGMDYARGHLARTAMAGC